MSAAVMETQTSSVKLICSPLLSRVVDSTEVRDISNHPEHMEEARLLLVAAYQRFANPAAGLTPDRVRATVCEDEYMLAGWTHTIAAFTTDGRGSKATLSCALRVMVGQKDQAGSMPAIEAMRFVDALPSWPHTTHVHEPNSIAEFGRYVLHPRYRTVPMKEAGIPAFLTRRLYEGCVSAVADKHPRFLYAIMPQFMASVCVRGGLQIREVPCRLRTDDREATRLFHDFSGYWMNSNPKLYQFLPLYV
jgi:hypothetical protein